MLPTKGYFQDIECPYFNSSCGRPYCHFRHRKKQSEHVEEVVAESESIIPTYKPTPKSQLANIQNNRSSHIPISYVPDLAFRYDKKFRSIKYDNPTYNPTPLSILYSANNRSSLSEESQERLEVINEIKQNIANVEYDPTISLQNVEDIDFEDLSNEFELIDEIINAKTEIDTEDFDPSKTEKKIASGGTKTSDKKDVESENTDENSLSSDKKEKKSKNTDLSSVSSDKKNKKSLTNDKKDKKDKRDKCSPSINKSDKCSPSINKRDKRSPSIDKRDKCSPSIDKRDKRSPSISKRDKRSPSIDKKDKHSPSIDKRDKHSPTRDKRDKRSSSSEKKDKKSSTKDKKDKKSLPNDENHKKDKRSNSKHESSKKREKQSHSSDENTPSIDKKNKRRLSSENKDRIRDKKEKRSLSIDNKDELRDKKDISIDNKEENISKRDRKDKRSLSSDNKDENPLPRDKKDKRSDNKDEISGKRSSSNEKKDKSDKKDCSSSDRKHKSRSPSEETSKKDKSSTGKHKSKETKEDKSKREKSSHGKSKDKEKRHKEDNKHKHKEKPIPHQEPTFLDSESDNEVNEDETMLECYRIFNEYNPPPKPQHSEPETDISTDIEEHHGKKRVAHSHENPPSYSKYTYNKPKESQNPGQTLTNRYKIAKMAQANREQELLMNEMHQPVAVKRPAPSLLEAARERKRLKEMEKQSNNLIDDILKGTAKTTVPTKIAPARNVLAMAKAKERISLIKPAAPVVKTIAHTQKGTRVAHIPDISLTDIPDVLQSDKSKLPVNVRTRFLTMLADECVKLYISKQEAYSRALKEEFNCYEKCKVLTTYRNSAMLAVNRLRKEIQERNKTGMGLIGVGDDGGGGSSSDSTVQFYDKIKHWILTEEELDIHGYPRQTDEYGVAVIKNFKSQLPSNLDENQRICSRCKKLYQVDDDGWPLFEEECCYHPMKKRTIRGEQTYLCCRISDETGCATSDTHVSDGFTSPKLEGFQTTMESDLPGDPRNTSVYALDCEMCYTTRGLELTRVTIIDTECKTVYESLVKPLNPIIDYNTRFSGITKEQLDKTSTSILQVQANILHLCNSRTILVGHSLESDMKALKIVHGCVIDTSVLFPHKMGLPHKRALRALASEYLRKIIQNDVSGHDSAEDAVTCMELLKWKLKEEKKSKPAK